MHASGCSCSIPSWFLVLILILILVPHHPCSLHPNISNSRRMYTMILVREVWHKHAAKSFLPSLTLQLCALEVATRSQVIVEERHLCNHVSEASLRISQLNFFTYSIAQPLYSDSWNLFRYQPTSIPPTYWNLAKRAIPSSVRYASACNQCSLLRLMMDLVPSGLRCTELLGSRGCPVLAPCNGRG